MGQEDRESAVPQSIVVETDMIDASWDDDDLVSGVELSPQKPEPESAEQASEDLGDRPTVVPDLQLDAQELLGGSESSRPTPSYHDRKTPTAVTGPSPAKPPSLEMPFDEAHSRRTRRPRRPCQRQLDDLELDLGDLPDLELDAGDRSACPAPAPARRWRRPRSRTRRSAR